MASLESLVRSSTGGLWGEPAGGADPDNIRVRVIRGAEFRNWPAERASAAPVRMIPRRALAGRELSEGDIVLEVSGGGPTQPVGRAILIDAQTTSQADLPLVCSNFCRRLEMAKPIETKYVWYQLQHLYSRGWTDQFQRATTNIRNLQVNAFLASTPLAIAPSDEQKRIVASIEEQFSRIDAAMEALERARKNLRRLRAGLLGAAISGRLVSQEPIEDSALRPTAHATDPAEPEQHGKALSPRPEVSRNFRLPDGWTWQNIREVCASVTDGDHQPPPKAEKGVPFLVIGNVRTGTIDFDGSRHVPQDYYDSLHGMRRPRKGDVLYTLVGSYGIPVLVTDDRPFCVQRHIGILRPNDRVDPAFLAVVMASSLVLAQARAYATGTAQMTVPLSGLRRIEVPIPPVGEQRRIVAELHGYEQFCGDLADAMARLVRRAGHLRSSILSAAFAGRLVPQKSDDEPASVLLASVSSDTAKARGVKAGPEEPALPLGSAATT